MFKRRLPITIALWGLLVFITGAIVPHLTVDSPLNWSAAKTNSACEGFTEITGHAANGAMCVDARHYLILSGFLVIYGCSAIVLALALGVIRFYSRHPVGAHRVTA